jgi:hypothetical protein
MYVAHMSVWPRELGAWVGWNGGACKYSVQVRQPRPGRVGRSLVPWVVVVVVCAGSTMGGLSIAS